MTPDPSPPPAMLKRFKSVPWLLVLLSVRVIYEHWQRADEADRRRAVEILRTSKGLPHKMTRDERHELVEIAKRIDHVALGRDLAATASPMPVPGLKTKPPKKAA
ncbi:MAG: hypothetical protein MUC84_04095 [Solirubrobacteraceae bacterium]|nr:hypothetical protein [Solirubrobacteraceae bacterium]